MKPVHVYRLTVHYPPGSDKPDWKPACWDDLLAGIKDRKYRREVARRGFRWPRERLFLSASGAYHRAALLTWFGAVASVQCSNPVTWWEDGPDPAEWWPEDAEEDPLDAAARYLYPAPESLEQGAEPADALPRKYQEAW